MVKNGKKTKSPGKKKHKLRKRRKLWKKIEAEETKKEEPIRPKLVMGKMSNDKLRREEFAFLSINREVICVPPGHPLFSKAKEKEIRVKGTNTDEDKLLRMAAELDFEIDAELREELGDEIANLAMQQYIL